VGRLRLAGTQVRHRHTSATLPLNYFDVAKDGRFLFTRAVGESVERRDELIVVENFGTELKTKAPR
jgi:hypothetical protein